MRNWKKQRLPCSETDRVWNMTQLKIPKPQNGKSRCRHPIGVSSWEKQENLLRWESKWHSVGQSTTVWCTHRLQNQRGVPSTGTKLGGKFEDYRCVSRRQQRKRTMARLWPCSGFSPTRSTPRHWLSNGWPLIKVRRLPAWTASSGKPSAWKCRLSSVCVNTVTMHNHCAELTSQETGRMHTDTYVPHEIADFVSDRAKNEGHAHKVSIITLSPEVPLVFVQSLVGKRKRSPFEKTLINLKQWS